MTLEEQLVAAKARIKELKGVLLSFAAHAVDCEGDEWICSLCGEKTPLSGDIEKFPHASFCPMHPEEA